jgi:thiamine transport system ATP-binding protein
MTTAGVALEAVDVTVSYGARTVLDHVGLQVRADEVVALLGPSGAGKSTLLQVLAGLLVPDAGRVAWEGADLAGVPAHRRRFGLVFQDALLFPHLDVAGNVAYGLRASRTPRDGRALRVGELLEMVGLAGYGGRAVATLSGGEAQRVALARALAPAPRLLLLDEPFGALDRELRDRLAVDVRDLLHALGTPAVHVTHDLAEADLVADRVLRLPDLVRATGAPAAAAGGAPPGVDDPV